LIDLLIASAPLARPELKIGFRKIRSTGAAVASDSVSESTLSDSITVVVSAVFVTRVFVVTEGLVTDFFVGSLAPSFVPDLPKAVDDVK
jgi:hypothetical protein